MLLQLIWLMFINVVICILKPEHKAETDIIMKSLQIHIGSISNSNISPSTDINLPKSSIRRRCQGFLACEHHVPIAEIEGAIFYKGSLYLNNYDIKDSQTIANLKNLYAGKDGCLPSVLVQRGGATEWIPGPRIIPITANSQIPKKCQSYTNSSMQILFPWEINNAFHTVNDNLMSVLSSTVLQHIYFKSKSHRLAVSNFHSLLVFKKLGGDSPSITLLYRIFKSLYGNQIIPSSSILTEGPHCVQHLAWGTSMKPFYKDSLFELRRVTFQVFHSALRQSPSFPSEPSLELQSPTRSRRGPKVVIVTRNATRPDPSPYRKLSRKSENALVAEFLSRGGSAVVCCNFQVVSTPSRLLSYFGHADICIGIHGAGLANCILGPENMIIVELQNDHAYGFDSFMKISHMATGVYIFYDLRNAQKYRGVGAGAVLEEHTIKSIVDLCMKIYSYIQTQRQMNAKIDYQWMFKNKIVSSRIIGFSESLRTTVSEELLKMVTASDKDKILIIPSPVYRYPEDLNAVYGPKFNETSDYCRTLDYFKFRKLLKSPMQEKNDCDRYIIHRKPSGLGPEAIRDFLLVRKSDPELLS